MNEEQLSVPTCQKQWKGETRLLGIDFARHLCCFVGGEAGEDADSSDCERQESFAPAGRSTVREAQTSCPQHAAAVGFVGDKEKSGHAAVSSAGRQQDQRNQEVEEDFPHGTDGVYFRAPVFDGVFGAEEDASGHETFFNLQLAHVADFISPCSLPGFQDRNEVVPPDDGD